MKNPNPNENKLDIILCWAVIVTAIGVLVVLEIAG